MLLRLTLDLLLYICYVTCLQVCAVFTAAHTSTTHWSSPLKLPAPFEFRIQHRRLAITSYAADIARQPSQSLHRRIPGRHTLFVGEQYTLEVGYQVKILIAQMAMEMKALMATNAMAFNGAGEVGAAYAKRAWSLNHVSGDAQKNEKNHQVFAKIAILMRRYPSLDMDVHVQTGSAEWTSPALAEYYKMDRSNDVQTLMDHLARNRADACIAALVSHGVDPKRLSNSFRGRAGRQSVDFRPRPPRRSRLGDPQSGLQYCRAHFTVQPPELLASAQDVHIRLAKATGDLKMLFRSEHADPSHWSHYLTVPHGMSLSVRHTGLNTLISEGAISVHERTCYVVGSVAPHQLFCMEHYTLELGGGRFFVQDTTSLLLRAGLQDVVMRVAWSTRLARCYITSADAGARGIP